MSEIDLADWVEPRDDTVREFKEPETPPDVRTFFPLEEFRPFQEETIVAIHEAFKTNKFVLVEAPTGSGKSPIAATFANQFLADKSEFIFLP